MTCENQKIPTHEWPPVVRVRKPTPEDLDRLRKMSKVALRELRQEQEELINIYPPADGETLSLVSD